MVELEGFCTRNANSRPSSTIAFGFFTGSVGVQQDTRLYFSTSQYIVDVIAPDVYFNKSPAINVYHYKSVDVKIVNITKEEK